MKALWANKTISYTESMVFESFYKWDKQKAQKQNKNLHPHIHT